MKKVLYVTVKTTPYKSRLFNALCKSIDLTVAYETEDIGARNKKWSNSEQLQHKHIFLSKKENKCSFMLVAWRLLRLIIKGWDEIIIGCFNLKADVIAILFMRLFHIPYVLNLDGETFWGGDTVKQKFKRFLVKGAKSYLIAGEKSADNLKKIVGNKTVQVYYFSSLTNKEILVNSSYRATRKDFVLVVGQYYNYKGMDVALQCALLDKNIHYKFVGMGKKQELFIKTNKCSDVSNIEFISFLQKEDLNQLYKTCACFVLPSHQECWGLVINEAASFGCPIVSTWGSGAAVEMLADAYPEYLAEPGNAESLLACIKKCLKTSRQEYSTFLKEKSADYTLEVMVKAHLNLLNL